MKKSLSIFRILMVAFVLIIGASTYQAVRAHDKVATVECLSMAFIAMPFTLVSSVTPKHKPGQWKKEGPMVCLTLTGPHVPTMQQTAQMPIATNTQIIGYLPGSMIPLPGTPANTGLSQSANTGETTDVTNIFADWAIGTALRFKYTFDDTYAGDPFILIPQYATDTLPAGITFTSTTWNNSISAMVAYYSKFPHVFNKVVVSVDEIKNFDHDIRLTQTLDDGNVTVKGATFNDIARDVYAQDETVREFNAKFVSGLDMRYEMVDAEIPAANTTKYMYFSFNIVGGVRSAQISRPRG